MIYRTRYKIAVSPNAPGIFEITTIGRGDISPSLAGMYTSAKQAMLVIDGFEDGRNVRKKIKAAETTEEE